MIRMSGYGKGHMRYCIDTGRQRMGLLRLDDMMEFYAGEQYDFNFHFSGYCVVCTGCY